MAFIECNFFSEVLGLSSSMNVILPEPGQGQVGMEGSETKEEYPVLYLLHGLSDDHTIWSRRTSIERYVASKGLAVVMPAVNKSFYTDMARGDKYYSFISEEVPRIARAFFPISGAREDNFVAGLSMGGYGAFKLALRNPDRYAAAASLSGSLDIAKVTVRRKNDNQWKNVFGDLDKIKDSDNDLLYLSEELSKSEGPKLKLFQCCGTEDFLYEDNQTFKAHAEKLGLDLTYEEEAGSHEWGYWDMKIQRILDWLPIR